MLLFEAIWLKIVLAFFKYIMRRSKVAKQTSFNSPLKAAKLENSCKKPELDDKSSVKESSDTDEKQKLVSEISQFQEKIESLSSQGESFIGYW